MWTHHIEIYEESYNGKRIHNLNSDCISDKELDEQE